MKQFMEKYLIVSGQVLGRDLTVSAQRLYNFGAEVLQRLYNFGADVLQSTCRDPHPPYTVTFLTYCVSCRPEGPELHDPLHDPLHHSDHDLATGFSLNLFTWFVC